VLAVDLHSHGRLGAFWSADDDRDDNGVRVCGVFGNVDRATPTARFRLVLNGHYVPLPSPWDADDAAEG
jgi:PRTRC genetic system protein A